MTAKVEKARATKNRRGMLIPAGLTLAGSSIWAYMLFGRPWHMRWGATGEEVARPMPGDDLVPDPKLKTTRALTIEAPADEVWPWLVQMGQGKAGLYSYDRLENLVFHIDMQNSDRIVPEFQHLEVGDVVKIMPGGGFTVTEMEPGRSFAMVARVNGSTMTEFDPAEGMPGNYFMASWAFALKEIDEQAARLVVRFKLDWHPDTPVNWIMWRVFTEPAHFIMERAMLLGIKRRAEGEM